MISELKKEYINAFAEVYDDLSVSISPTHVKIGRVDRYGGMKFIMDYTGAYELKNTDTNIHNKQHIEYLAHSWSEEVRTAEKVSVKIR